MKARFGRYVLLKKLAAGGMAEVFLARRLSFGGFARFVVIKRLLPEHSGRKAYVRLFLAEARMGALLNHPNIVGLHDLGQLDDAYFMAMEYVHGVSAAEVLTRSAKLEKPLPLGAALRIAGSVAEALHYAHHATGLDGEPLGIIHHDISPQNVQISFDGDVKLLDFGVATRNGHAPTGGRRGKYGYMSPEAMARGKLDHRSDVFSLGVVLYELTMGRRLFKGEGTEPPADPRRAFDPPTKSDPAYPASLEPLVMQALATEPDARFSDAGTLGRSLTEVARNLGVATGPEALAAYLRDLFGDEIHARRLELAELAQKSDTRRSASSEAKPTEGAQAKPTHIAGAPDVAAAKPPEPAPSEDVQPSQEAPAGAAEPSGVDVDLDDLDAPPGPELEAPEAVLDERPLHAEVLAPPADPAWRRVALGLAFAGVALAVGTLFLGRRWGESPPHEGSLTVESVPEGARVFDGQRLLGMTPMAATRRPLGARYELRVVAPGFEEHRITVELKQARPHVFVAAALRPVAAQPAAVDGVPTASTPLEVR